MDRSFLSDAKVVQASRNFVCLRLATYEDADEAKFLSKVFTRGGDLENTVFSILSHDGMTPLARSGRGPGFSGPSQMARTMNQIVAEKYPLAANQFGSELNLPEMKDLELGINVASCDLLPVVVAIGEGAQALANLKQSLVKTAWDRDLAGQFVFASALTSDDLRPLYGLQEEPKAGLYLAEPGEYGLTAKIVMALDEDHEQRKKQLTQFLSQYNPQPKHHRQHVTTGFQLGFKWETAIPVTDRQAVQAATRLWGKDQP